MGLCLRSLNQLDLSRIFLQALKNNNG